MRKYFPRYASLGTVVLLSALVVTIASPSFATISLLLLTTLWTIFSAYKLELFSTSIKTHLDSGIAETARKEHQLLLESIHHYPMPYALYDENNRLCVWNKHYEKIYSRVFEKLENPSDAKHLNYEELLRSNVADDLSGEELERYVCRRVAEQRAPESSSNDRHYPNQGWYRVSKYQTPSGGVAGFAIDINELKQREKELLEEVERRKKLEIEIRELANTDFLTGIPNRRHFIEKANTNFRTCPTIQGTLSLLMIDIDLFKSVNDSRGHLIGDEVIGTVAKTTSKSLKIDNGFVGRLGGEEFAVLLPSCSIMAAKLVAERIRCAIQSISFVSNGTSFSVTVSIGVATKDASDDHFSSLMRRSDDALYSAKCNGRNRVVVDYSDSPKLKQVSG